MLKKEHISQFDEQELTLFLVEKMEQELLAKWQKHYSSCEECRKYVDNNSINDEFVEAGENSVSELSEQWQRQIANHIQLPAGDKEDIWQWLYNQSESIELPLSFFKKDLYYAFPTGVAAATIYEPGQRYASIQLPVSEVSSPSYLQLLFSFYWTEVLWGHVDLNVDAPIQLANEEKKRFFKTLYTDLYTSDGKALCTNMNVDKNGNFLITENQEELEEIKQYLVNSQLKCAVKFKLGQS